MASIATTTGFTSENYELWSPLGHVVLLLLMYIGGCTGSTAGGIKVSRAVMLSGVVSRELKRIVERRGVFAVRLGGQAIPEPVVMIAGRLEFYTFVAILTPAFWRR